MKYKPRIKDHDEVASLVITLHEPNSACSSSHRASRARIGKFHTQEILAKKDTCSCL